MLERDFVGYGMNPPKVKWPGGARLCVSVNVAYEEGSEMSLLDGDPTNEPTGETASLIRPDVRDLWKESYFEYGSRVGVWRIMDTLDKYDVKATWFANALALERNLQVAQEITRRGHDIVGRGYKWLEHSTWDRETERQDMRHSIESLERTTGQRPLGWMVRDGPSVHTRELLVEEGILYDSHPINDEIPYYVDVKGKKLLVVPYTTEINDFRFWVRTTSPAQAFYDCMKDAFDLLYEEGTRNPKMMSIGLHCRAVGRPSRAWTIDRFFRYAKGFPGVWFARRSDIARWWLENYPPQ